MPPPPHLNWLEEFQNLIKSEWRHEDGQGTLNDVWFVESLKNIKSKIMELAVARYKSRDKILKDVEEEIRRL
jgi:hypothetical protein